MNGKYTEMKIPPHHHTSMKCMCELIVTDMRSSCDGIFRANWSFPRFACFKVESVAKIAKLNVGGDVLGDVRGRVLPENQS